MTSSRLGVDLAMAKDVFINTGNRHIAFSGGFSQRYSACRKIFPAAIEISIGIEIWSKSPFADAHCIVSHHSDSLHCRSYVRCTLIWQHNDTFQLFCLKGRAFTQSTVNFRSKRRKVLEPEFHWLCLFPDFFHCGGDRKIDLLNGAKRGTDTLQHASRKNNRHVPIFLGLGAAFLRCKIDRPTKCQSSEYGSDPRRQITNILQRQTSNCSHDESSKKNCRRSQEKSCRPEKRVIHNTPSFFEGIVA